MGQIIVVVGGAATGRVIGKAKAALDGDPPKPLRSDTPELTSSEGCSEGEDADPRLCPRRPKSTAVDPRSALDSSSSPFLLFDPTEDRGRKGTSEGIALKPPFLFISCLTDIAHARRPTPGVDEALKRDEDRPFCPPPFISSYPFRPFLGRRSISPREAKMLFRVLSCQLLRLSLLVPLNSSPSLASLTKRWIKTSNVRPVALSADEQAALVPYASFAR